MEPGNAARPRPLQELVLELEDELRVRLAGVRLVLEAGLDDPTFERVEAAVDRLSRAEHGEAWLSRKLPALLLVHLVGCGSRMETEFWARASVGGRFDQQVLGPAFERAVDKLHLETFPELVDERAHRFVAPILAHGGIPRYAAERYLGILIGTLNRYGMASAGELVALWRSRRTALEFGQRPIRRFLLYGGAPALDYLDRSIELVRLDPDQVRVTRVPELQLPEHIIEAYLRYAERAGAASSVARGAPALPRPHVALDPFDPAGPYVELPALTVGLGRGTWTVDDGTAVGTYRTSALETRRLPLAPSLSWSVELRLDEGAVRTAAFEALGQSPYVLFDPASGAYVDDLRPVALDACWVLAPRDAVLRASDAAGQRIEINELTTLPKPGGAWTGFTVRHLDLDQVATLTIANPDLKGGSIEGHVRVVAAGSRPRLIGEPAASVVTADGAPVFASAPSVFVPRLIGVDDDRWQITIATSDGRRTDSLTKLGRSGAEVSLAEVIPTNGLAVVDLTIRGPLGSDLRRRFAIVPGIAATVPATVLLPGDEAGRYIEVHADASVELGLVGGVSAAGHMRIPIPADGDRVTIRGSSDGRSVDLAVRFPRLLWAIRRPGSLPRLAAARERIDADELIDGLAESLLISTLLADVRVVVALEDGADVVHELPAGRTAPPDGRWAVSLAPLRDTVRIAATARLTLAVELGGRRVPVADIVATAKAVDIRAELVDADGGRQARVVFTEDRHLADTVVRLWPLERPWRPPLVAPVPGDFTTEVRFPPAAVPVGRYRVEIAVDDAWFSPRRPVAGAPSCADVEIGDRDELRAADLQLEESGDPADLVSLAIVTGLVPREFESEHVGAAWAQLAAAVRGLLADSVVDPRARRPLRALVRLMASDPRLMLEQLAVGEDGAFEPTEQTRIYLLARSCFGDGVLPALPERVLRPLWRACPPLAALVDVPAARSGDAEAIARCEEHLGWRPDGEPPPVGRGPDLATLSLTPARQATIRDLLALVPRALLSWDSYQVACFEWLAACSADPKRAERWRIEGMGAVDGLTFGPEFDRYLAARRGVPHPDFKWADGLRGSLACAGHVVVNDGLTDLSADALEDLLALSPLLVTHDLVLAQVLLAPEQAAFIRALVPQEQGDAPAASDGRWRDILESAGRQEVLSAVVDRINEDGVVIARVDGFTGRVKAYERGWTEVERARPIAVGDAISVVVIDADPIQRRLELSIRRAQANPWHDPGRRPVVGDVIDVTVTGVKSFGLFVTAETGIDGLLHVSSLHDDDLPEARDERASLLETRYPIGSRLRAQVVEIDPVAERMSLTAIDA